MPYEWYDFLHVTGGEAVMKRLNNMPKITELCYWQSWDGNVVMSNPGIILFSISPSLESR